VDTHRLSRVRVFFLFGLCDPVTAHEAPGGGAWGAGRRQERWKWNQAAAAAAAARARARSRTHTHTLPVRAQRAGSAARAIGRSCVISASRKRCSGRPCLPTARALFEKTPCKTPCVFCYLNVLFVTESLYEDHYTKIIICMCN
jgi:hypothetical protein